MVKIECALIINDFDEIFIVKDLKKDEWRFPIVEIEGKEDDINNDLDYSFFTSIIAKEEDVEVCFNDDDISIEGRFYKYKDFINNIREEYLPYKRWINIKKLKDITLDQRSKKLLDQMKKEKRRIQNEYKLQDKIDSLKKDRDDIADEIEIYRSAISKLIYYINKHRKNDSPKFEDAINYYGVNYFDDDELDIIYDAPTYYDSEDDEDE